MYNNVIVDRCVCVRLCLYALLTNACVFVCKMLYILYDTVGVYLYRWTQMEKDATFSSFIKRQQNKEKKILHPTSQTTLHVRMKRSVFVLSFEFLQYVPLLRDDQKLIIWST